MNKHILMKLIALTHHQIHITLMNFYKMLSYRRETALQVCVIVLETAMIPLQRGWLVDSKFHTEGVAPHQPFFLEN